MQDYSIEKVAEIVAGTLTVQTNQTVISELVIDSRKLNSPASSLFFAIVTNRNDGHKYIEELINRGVQNFCVKNVPPEFESKANFVIVSDTLEALQKLTAYHRSQFNYPVIGITGSNGKTIVKEWLWQLLSEEKTIVRSPQSYNSQVGVPLSVWQMGLLHDLAIFEAGISQPGEMVKLEEVIKPNIGLITNIGSAHDQYFNSAEQKTKEKLMLFRNADQVIYCRDSDIIHEGLFHSGLFADKITGSHERNFFSWGWHDDSKLRITNILKDNFNTSIEAVYNEKQLAITIPFTDEASVENAMHCWAVMLLLGYGPEVTRSRMLKLVPVAMRLEMKEGINGSLIINDSYSSDLDSLANALDFLIQQSRHENKTVILSDMLQSSVDEEQLYGTIAQLLKQKGINRLIGIGESIIRHQHLFSMPGQYFKSTEDFITQLPHLIFSNEGILIKGARVFAFERIIELLQQKAHETVLEVNLSSLVHNLNYFRSQIKPSTKVMAMVKAFSYGSGSFEIANILQFHHVDYLGVAYADEGVELRKAGISLPVMVMNPEMTGMELMIRYGLEPEIYSFRTLELFAKTAETLKHRSANSTLIHLKLDTGMHRLGFMEEELDELVYTLEKYPHLKIGSAFSHLAGSESEELDAFTHQQIECFERMTKKLANALGYPFMRHILNSAGITRHAYAQFDMVRLGISLYGISSIKEIQDKLEVVSSLKSVISQIKVIKEGETVGYNCRWKAPRVSKIAIIPIGYADGLGRKLSNGKGIMFLNDQLVPIIGSINMDMTVLDITGIEAEEGDEVEVFGNKIPINTIAENLETIPYEILTGISRRVKRVYFQE
ncbi:MAG TPA: bifunctional UDP-N-acetylmuramoyl-tripeptide:D-alanyl-D-alanine ligase/alanine racemase [Lentimicrobium sp.]|nr:bifunctional UDP-N-acetylmuramoyl-tripeptide:D-alanyl-D-alanine ligase/alanine racemase [Lentimicrobium sp.]